MTTMQKQHDTKADTKRNLDSDVLQTLSLEELEVVTGGHHVPPLEYDIPSDRDF